MLIIRYVCTSVPLKLGMQTPEHNNNGNGKEQGSIGVHKHIVTLHVRNTQVLRQLYTKQLCN